MGHYAAKSVYLSKDIYTIKEFFASLKCSEISFIEATCCIGPDLNFISQESYIQSQT